MADKKPDLTDQYLNSRLPGYLIVGATVFAVTLFVLTGLALVLSVSWVKILLAVVTTAAALYKTYEDYEFQDQRKKFRSLRPE